MKITIIPVGQLEANCYILEKDGKILIIDPGDDYSKINQKIQNKEIVKILITHHHPDHIGALNNFDKNLIFENPKEQSYNFGPFSFTVIKTKGHTTDSVTYYFKKEKIMFTGDFLFKGTIGRTDMFGGNMEEMKQSNFSDKDIENAKRAIITNIKNIKEEQDIEISYYYGQELSDIKTSIEEYIQNIENVTRQDILDVANSVSINTIYFLRN